MSSVGEQAQNSYAVCPALCDPRGSLPSLWGCSAFRHTTHSGSGSHPGWTMVAGMVMPPMSSGEPRRLWGFAGSVPLPASELFIPFTIRNSVETGATCRPFRTSWTIGREHGDELTPHAGPEASGCPQPSRAARDPAQPCTSCRHSASRKRLQAPAAHPVWATGNPARLGLLPVRGMSSESVGQAEPSSLQRPAVRIDPSNKDMDVSVYFQAFQCFRR